MKITAKNKLITVNIIYNRAFGNMLSVFVRKIQALYLMSMGDFILETVEIFFWLECFLF